MLQLVVWLYKDKEGVPTFPLYSIVPHESIEQDLFPCEHRKSCSSPFISTMSVARFGMPELFSFAFSSSSYHGCFSASMY
jgi:hypothetical protein